MTLLCTGYEPFGGDDQNPTADVARALDSRRIGGHEVVGHVLPVEFDAVRPALADLIDDHDPAIIIGTGLAAGRAGVSLERVGVNVDDAVTTPDNAAASPESEAIEPDGPDACFSTLPNADAVSALLEAGIPARLSNSAGTHCCNHHLYATQRLLAERELRAGKPGGADELSASESGVVDDRSVPAGFVHLPLTPAMAASKAAGNDAHRGGGVQPSLPLNLQVDAVETVCKVVLEQRG